MVRKATVLWSVIVVVLAGVSVWLLWLNQAKDNKLEPLNSELVEIQEAEYTKDETQHNSMDYTGTLAYLTDEQLSASSNTALAEKATAYELLLAETAQAIYSTDPYVEAFSLTRRAQECEFFKARNIEYSLNESDSGRVILNKKRSLCEQWQTDFPLLSSPQSWIKKLSELPADSKLGQLVKQFPSLSDFNQRTEYAVKAFELGIKEKSPYLIEYALTQIEQPFSILNAADNDLSTTDNGTYAAFIFSTAVNLMLCEFNQEEFCSGYSWKMINKCTSETSYCGLTYQEWFDRSLMPGMKQDVLVLLEQFQHAGQLVGYE